MRAMLRAIIHLQRPTYGDFSGTQVMVQFNWAEMQMILSALPPFQPFPLAHLCRHLIFAQTLHPVAKSGSLNP